MFQLADADRCCAVFVCLGEKVECIAPCQLPSVLPTPLKMKKTITCVMGGVRNDLLNQVFESLRDEVLEFLPQPCSVNLAL